MAANPSSRRSFASHKEDDVTAIHKQLCPDDIENLKELFEKQPNKKFGYNEFRNVLEKFNLFFNNQDYQTVFRRINSNRDNHCDWDEFLSYLILGFQKDDPFNQKTTLVSPISKINSVQLSQHRLPIISIGLICTVLADNTIRNDGCYITASKDGTVNFWSQDLNIERSGVSKNPYLKFSQTWILAVQALSDVRIICTSSTERDLRFYDITAVNFTLRLIVTGLPWAVNCLHYCIPPPNSIGITSKLILGDIGGNIRVIEYNAELRGPFQSKPGAALIEITWSDFVQAKTIQVQIREFPNIHQDMIRQVGFIDSLNYILSCSECHTDAPNYPGLASLDIAAKKNTNIFNMAKGTSCFTIDAENLILATGGPDCILRLWNLLVPQKPMTILPGHNSGIVFIFIQPKQDKIYSIDHDKIIKVWNILEQTLVQTFIGIIQALPEHSPFCCYYNPASYELLVAARKIASVKCSPPIRTDLTDGETHSRAVSVVLYNNLFKNIVTCGLDSFIIVWDPWINAKRTLIKQAHTHVINGEILRVEITAGCFDPKEQLLLTGASNGTLKIWNFNSGVCIRNLAIENMCEVTTVFWIPSRILAMGWNQHVTEFPDVEGQEYSDEQNWAILHNADISCGSVYFSDTLATGSFSGELVLWDLRTQEPYQKFDVKNPKVFEKLERYSKENETKHNVSKVRYTRNLSRSTISSESEPISNLNLKIYNKNVTNIGSNKMRNRISVVPMPKRALKIQKLGIKAITFLETRHVTENHGTLFVALDNGLIQVYSHHIHGGFIEQFLAIHMSGDCVVAMDTDKQNKYLFIATALGYIKTWLLTNFCVPQADKIHISIPKLRLKFPFLLKTRFIGRAERSVKGLQTPMLLNSFKAHLNSISSITYIELTRIIVSGSTDFTVRLWTLGGRYLGTLGSPVPWETLSSTECINEQRKFRNPPDIYKVASSTTLKVLTGGKNTRYTRLNLPNYEEKEMNEEIEITAKSIYGKPLTKPILGKHFKIPPQGRIYANPVLDKSLPYIPVYSHLKVYQAKPIERPPTPEILKRIKNTDFMNK